jgi:hypothetical protein
LDTKPPFMRSSVSTTWVRVFFLFLPLRGMVVYSISSLNLKSNPPLSSVALICSSTFDGIRSIIERILFFDFCVDECKTRTDRRPYSAGLPPARCFFALIFDVARDNRECEHRSEYCTIWLNTSYSDSIFVAVRS